MHNYIGNDIVDITQHDILIKYKDARFIRRVFSDQEIVCLNNSKRPDLLLWFIWSAKEAAYKAIKKYKTDTVFAHKKFNVRFLEYDYIHIGNDLKATVEYENIKCDINWSYTSSWIHCNATLELNKNAEYKKLDYKVMKIIDILDYAHFFSDEEKISIHSEQSKAVRVLGKALLYQHGIEKAQIIRRPKQNRFEPPIIYTGFKELKTWDISMTHDGDFVACAILKRSDKEVTI